MWEAVECVISVRSIWLGSHNIYAAGRLHYEKLQPFKEEIAVIQLTVVKNP